MPIPLIIHQTSASKMLSPQARRFRRSFATLNPGWKMKLYDDRDARSIIEAHLPDFLAAYDAFAHPIQRADMFRIAVVYLYGGVYADLDVRCLKPLDGIVAANCVFPLESATTRCFTENVCRTPQNTR